MKIFGVPVKRLDSLQGVGIVVVHYCAELRA